MRREKLRADFYEEMFAFGKEVYGIDLKKLAHLLVSSPKNCLFRTSCEQKRTFSLSQESRAKLVSALPWRENASLKGTFSLSQESRDKLVSALPWRENASLKGTF
ncbi:MAG: hypothetical protein IJ586_08035 [Alloprevotella sp.]|nr:hypothetical protein [Alloprevotella sp.]